eukprot:SAG22_NODE_43_length_25304_cov_5.394644_4_plen_86_part_00
MIAWRPAIRVALLTPSASVCVYSHESQILMPSGDAAFMIAPTGSAHAPAQRSCCADRRGARQRRLPRVSTECKMVLVRQHTSDEL